MGPIQFLRKSRKNSILYYQGDDPPPAAEELRKQILHLGKLAKKCPAPTPLNLLNIDMFLLPCLFLLDSPNRETLEDLVVIAIGKRKTKAVSIAVTAGLSNLRREGLLRHVPSGLDFRGVSVRRTAAGVQLTQKGMSQFLKTNRRGQWRYFFKPPNYLIGYAHWF